MVVLKEPHKNLGVCGKGDKFLIRKFRHRNAIFKIVVILILSYFKEPITKYKERQNLLVLHLPFTLVYIIPVRQKVALGKYQSFSGNVGLLGFALLQFP